MDSRRSFQILQHAMLLIMWPRKGFPCHPSAGTYHADCAEGLYSCMSCKNGLVPWYQFQFLCLLCFLVASIPGCNQELFMKIYGVIVTSRDLETANLDALKWMAFMFLVVVMFHRMEMKCALNVVVCRGGAFQKLLVSDYIVCKCNFVPTFLRAF